MCLILALCGAQLRAPVDLVEHERRVLKAQVAKRHPDLRVRDPLACVDHDDLVGAVNKENAKRYEKSAAHTDFAWPG